MKFGPNGRTIRRALMKGRFRGLFGQRAYITVRAPLEIFPVKPPKFEALGDPQALTGRWGKEDPEGTYSIYDICRVSGSAPPGALFVVDNGSYQEWWEGARIVYKNKDSAEIVRQEDLDKDLIGACRGYYYWEREHGLRLDGSLGEAINLAKTTMLEVKWNSVHITFGVKWFRHKTKLRFCGALRRAFKEWGLKGVKLKLLK